MFEEDVVIAHDSMIRSLMQGIARQVISRGQEQSVIRDIGNGERRHGLGTRYKVLLK